MPELPEVETVVRQLRSKIVGKKITKLTIQDHKVIDSAIRKYLPATITDIVRKGKAIIISLDNSYYLLAHLRMTGHFYYVDEEENKDYQKYLSGIFHFTDGGFLTYNEIRRFGTVKLLSRADLEAFSARQGVEPLSSAFTLSLFRQLLSRYPNAVLKNKLMDQSFITGVGNIYAQEALYHAGIHPETKIKDVSPVKIKKLYFHLKDILELAVKNNGTSIITFQHMDGKGDFQDFLAVYHKENCPKGHPVERIVVGGRGTFYCGRCQKFK